VVGSTAYCLWLDLFWISFTTGVVKLVRGVGVVKKRVISWSRRLARKPVVTSR